MGKERRSGADRGSGRGGGGGRGSGRGRGNERGVGRGSGSIGLGIKGGGVAGKGKISRKKQRKAAFEAGKGVRQAQKHEADSEDQSASEGEEEPSEAEGKKKSSEQSSKGQNFLHGFTSKQRILLVGEGDFSFSRALSQRIGGAANVVATAFDSEETVLEKYKGSEEILAELRSLGAIVRFKVDATRLQQSLHTGKKKRKAGEMAVLDHPFDRIIFNFPHVGLGIKDEAINIQKNKELLCGFFQSAVPLLGAEGQVHVALKTGKPYEHWNVTGVAHRVGGLKLLATRPFRPTDFPGYHHRRTIGFIEGLSAADNEEIAGRARTFIFGPQ